jgi:hypothetical protein
MLPRAAPCRRNTVEETAGPVGALSALRRSRPPFAEASIAAVVVISTIRAASTANSTGASLDGGTFDPARQRIGGRTWRQEVTSMSTNETAAPDEPRERAIKRLKQRRDFYGHLLVYTLVNGAFVGIWAVTGRPGFFWPIVLILLWGVGLALNAWDVYRNDTFTEEQIQREIDHLQGRRRPS